MSRFPVPKPSSQRNKRMNNPTKRKVRHDGDLVASALTDDPLLIGRALAVLFGKKPEAGMHVYAVGKLQKLCSKTPHLDKALVRHLSGNGLITPVPEKPTRFYLAASGHTALDAFFKSVHEIKAAEGVRQIEDIVMKDPLYVGRALIDIFGRNPRDESHVYAPARLTNLCEKDHGKARSTVTYLHRLGYMKKYKGLDGHRYVITPKGREVIQAYDTQKFELQVSGKGVLNIVNKEGQSLVPIFEHPTWFDNPDEFGVADAKECDQAYRLRVPAIERQFLQQNSVAAEMLLTGEE